MFSRHRIFVALHNTRDDNHHAAEEIALDLLTKNKYGKPVTTTYILDEALTAAKCGPKGNHHIAVKVASMIQSPPIQVDSVEPALLPRALELFKSYHDKNFSHTDCTVLAHMQNNPDIGYLLSFDSEFDKVAKGFVRVHLPNQL